jgi:hypothetical protein
VLREGKEDSESEEFDLEDDEAVDPEDQIGDELVRKTLANDGLSGATEHRATQDHQSQITCEKYGGRVRKWWDYGFIEGSHESTLDLMEKIRAIHGRPYGEKFETIWPSTELAKLMAKETPPDEHYQYLSQTRKHYAYDVLVKG